MENGTFELTTALDDCGTQLEFVNDQVVFQQMVYGYAIAGDLFLGRPTELEFTCTYNTNYGQSNHNSFLPITNIYLRHRGR